MTAKRSSPIASVAASNAPEVADRQILVLDDDPIVVDEAVEVLKHAGFDCVGETDPLAALFTCMRRSEISVVVTGVKMPGLSGFEVARYLREKLAPERKIAVIAVFDRAGAGHAIEALRAGCHDILDKPLCPDQLVRAVGRALETLRV